MILFTSGTTGPPKGVVIPVWALASFEAYMRFGLDHRADDVFLNISDPGWGYGLFYGIVGPLALGHATLLRNVRFYASDLLDAVVRHRVTNLCGPATAFRALRNEGVKAEFRSRSFLRSLSSAGEPLTAEVGVWAQETFGIPIHDHYGQTELGMVVGYRHGFRDVIDVEPGLMGPSLPGFRMVVLDNEGSELADGSFGELAVDTYLSPLFWFQGYLNNDEATAERFPFGERYYVTADRAFVGSDGVFGSAVRSDDVITSSGYRIGPFDIEAALLLVPEVAEVAVIGTPDPYRIEAVTALVVLKPDVAATAALTDRLVGSVRDRVGVYAAPRRVAYVEALPRTASGKIQRSLLRTQWPPVASATRATRIHEVDT